MPKCFKTNVTNNRNNLAKWLNEVECSSYLEKFKFCGILVTREITPLKTKTYYPLIPLIVLPKNEEGLIILAQSMFMSTKLPKYKNSF